MDKSHYQRPDYSTNMNESEFKKKWESERPTYSAWGKYILQTISEALKDIGKNLDIFLKVPAQYRLKPDESLIDKAFYRPAKNYADPYNDIEDKVGIRFVVLLLDNIKEISRIINEHSAWAIDPCKHFEEDKKANPLLFTYQSVHYILRPKSEMVFDGLQIPSSTPCEVQIRTLLQHAHAELTHDAVYKAKKTVQPQIHRTVAKSMALIETTDGFFSEVTKELNSGPLEDLKIIERLDSLYFNLTGLQSHNQKSAIAIWDAFNRFITEDLIDKIQKLIGKLPILTIIIKREYGVNSFYQQSTVLFVYWLLLKKKDRLLLDWPLSRNMLEPLASDLGVSLYDE